MKQFARDDMLPNPAFWKGKRVLLTGHTGFKGAWASIWLNHMGAQVTGFALPPETSPSLYTLANVDTQTNSVFGNLCDRKIVQTVVEECSPQIVIHMAAQALVRPSFEDPVGTLETNVLGTTYLLEALREAPDLQAALIITSDKVYANSDIGIAFTEEDRLGGKDPYSASKACTELVTHSYRQCFFKPVGKSLVSARAGNVIGGGDYSQQRLVPDIIRSIEANEALTLRHPEATRPWQHVLDCIAGYMMYIERLVESLADATEIPESLNFGPSGKDLTVASVADAMLNALRSKRRWEHVPIAGSMEMEQLAVDSTKARTVLGWSDRLSGSAVIDATAKWYEQVGRGVDPLVMTLQQIEEYMARTRVDNIATTGVAMDPVVLKSTIDK